MVPFLKIILDCVQEDINFIACLENKNIDGNLE